MTLLPSLVRRAVALFCIGKGMVVAFNFAEFVVRRDDRNLLFVVTAASAVLLVLGGCGLLAGSRWGRLVLVGWAVLHVVFNAYAFFHFHWFITPLVPADRWHARWLGLVAFADRALLPGLIAALLLQPEVALILRRRGRGGFPVRLIAQPEAVRDDGAE